MNTDVLTRLETTLNARKGADPASSYTAKLFSKGLDTILKKIGEEATELVIAGKAGESSQIIYESADVIYHLMVLLASANLSMEDVLSELARREGVSGIAEKAARPA